MPSPLIQMAIDLSRRWLYPVTKKTVMLTHNRKIAIALAFASVLPTPLPLAWLHKFYLGQYLWGIIYLVLAPTLLPQVACCLEGVWYMSQSDDGFASRFPKAGSILPATVSAFVTGNALETPNAPSTTDTLRDLDQLRQEGLVTEYEFEQKRRKLLDQI
jgi:TM2 domain-containing membrane protein YozV